MISDRKCCSFGIMTPDEIRQRIASLLGEIQDADASLTFEYAHELTRQSVILFFEYLNLTGGVLRESVEILCRLNCHPDPQISRIALNALFPNLIEVLNDSFNPKWCPVYDELFAQVISFYRQLPECADFNNTLLKFGLETENDIFTRKRALAVARKHLNCDRELKKIILLSRVTIGADVAITSIMMSHLKTQFVDAEIILIGSEKLRQLYGGDPQIRVHEIFYGRGDTLTNRLNGWATVVDAIQQEISDLSSEEFCIFDPDSRLTQLGLLPLLSKESEHNSYFYFESRSLFDSNLKKIGEITDFWMKQCLAVTESHYPFLALPSEALSSAEILRSCIKELSTKKIICLSFGTGGNNNKRINLEFETSLVRKLVQKNFLIIDRGVSNDELNQSDFIKQALLNDKKELMEINESDIFQKEIFTKRPDIILCYGGIGFLASLIAISDQYLGYDSSGQHLAAALNIPTGTIFLSPITSTFFSRWQPLGMGKLDVFNITRQQTEHIEEILSLVSVTFNC